jgi:hypothetical protein
MLLVEEWKHLEENYYISNFGNVTISVSIRNKKVTRIDKDVFNNRVDNIKVI